MALVFPLLAGVATDAVAAQASAASVSSKTGERAGREVPYAELEQHIGERIEIRSTYGTVRRGVLTKYTNVELTLRLDFGKGTIELTVPKDTVASAWLLGPEPAAHGARNAARAEKN